MLPYLNEYGLTTKTANDITDTFASFGSEMMGFFKRSAHMFDLQELEFNDKNEPN